MNQSQFDPFDLVDSKVDRNIFLTLYSLQAYEADESEIKATSTTSSPIKHNTSISVDESIEESEEEQRKREEIRSKLKRKSEKEKKKIVSKRIRFV